jgi:hypothetical protein
MSRLQNLSGALLRHIFGVSSLSAGCACACVCVRVCLDKLLSTDSTWAMLMTPLWRTRIWWTRFLWTRLRWRTATIETRIAPVDGVKLWKTAMSPP